MASEFTLGVEEEYQLICADTADLTSRASRVIATDWSGDITPETQETTVEIGTRVCDSAADLGRELRRLRFQVATAAAAEGLCTVAAGLHPFSRWTEQTQTEGERYDRIIDRYGQVMRSEHIFGMHIHVAVPEQVDRALLMNDVRAYIPHLLALAASSPIFEGEETGYASYRTILNRRLPHTGPPPRFGSEDELRAYLALLLSTGCIDDEYTIYWSIRAHPEYPTVEFRVTDACPRVEDAVAIAALTRAIVAAAAAGELPASDHPFSGSAADALLASNEWQAARYGLEATLVDPAGDAGKRTLVDSVGQLLESVGPVAERLGDVDALAGVGTILARGNGADRIRDRLSSGDELPELAQWLARESLLGVGLDRRAEQREALV
ncbi:MAG: YbdK family carboxylate-amine ligase [Gemmatimonadota bacterium]